MIQMLIPTHLCEALSVRIPDANFAPYFAFIESLPTLEHGNRHHILPRKDFPEHAKNPDNVIRISPADHFRAHYWLAVCAPRCESFQRVFFFMTKFREYASQVPIDELPQYAEVYERGRMKQIEIARKHGFDTVKNGQLKEAARQGGMVQGHKNIENGHMSRLGKMQGRKSVETGQLDSIRTSENCAKGGRLGGRKVADSGALYKALHIRWHVIRNIMNPVCRFCEKPQ
jgi:hypothetical protein